MYLDEATFMIQTLARHNCNCNCMNVYRRGALSKVTDALSCAPIQDSGDEQINPNSLAVDYESEPSFREETKPEYVALISA